MEKDRIEAYARLRLERAREDLDTAHLNIHNGYFRAAINRSYYAVFYMASAALFSQSIQRAKHSGIESAFGQYLIKTGHIEPEFSRIYKRARLHREEADYAETLIDEPTARQILTESERFVARMERFLKSEDVL